MGSHTSTHTCTRTRTHTHTRARARGAHTTAREELHEKNRLFRTGNDDKNVVLSAGGSNACSAVDNGRERCGSRQFDTCHQVAVSIQYGVKAMERLIWDHHDTHVHAYTTKYVHKRMYESKN